MINHAIRKSVGLMVKHDLKKSFRRVCWIGTPPIIADDEPVVFYSNHQYFHDGYLLWIASIRLFKRTTITWMEDWHHFPFFAALGAMPFSSNDPKQRAQTILRTTRRFKENPKQSLIYFPEGNLHSSDDEVSPINTEALQRLQRILYPAKWLPVAIHVTWKGEALPSALIKSGPLQYEIDGQERERLQALRSDLRIAGTTDRITVFEGRHSPQEHWNFHFLSPFFKRFL